MLPHSPGPLEYIRGMSHSIYSTQPALTVGTVPQMSTTVYVPWTIPVD